MKKRLFLTGITCLILGAFITGCDHEQEILDKSRKAKLEGSKESFGFTVNRVYTRIMNPEPDAKQEALFIKEYTNQWLEFSEIMSRTEEVAIAIQEELYDDDEERLENISVYITIDNDREVNDKVLVEFKENE